MKTYLRTVLMIVLVCILVKPSYAQQNLSKAIVKIYTVYTEYDYDMPWQISKQQGRSGSGCIISGKRILTNAHVIADQRFVQVKRAGEVKKYVAEVEFVAHDCDLAVLKVSDDAFFNGAEPIAIGNLSKMQDKVAVYGFPEGGDELSITEGVVSRVEYQHYAHSAAYLLACQIDAAINAVKTAISSVEPIHLEDYHVKSVTGGTDAMVEVVVRLRKGDRTASAMGVREDIVKASVEAVISGMNVLMADYNNKTGRGRGKREK